LPKFKETSRYPTGSIEHQIGVRLMRRMKYFLEGYEKKYGRPPTFEVIFVKSVELAPEVADFKTEYKKMYDTYARIRRTSNDIYDVFDEISHVLFGGSVVVRFSLDPTLDVGYVDGYENRDYTIKTPFSWFTLLHEFVHIVLREVDYPDDERVAYVIPSGIFYDFKFYGKRRSTLEDFI